MKRISALTASVALLLAACSGDDNGADATVGRADSGSLAWRSDSGSGTVGADSGPARADSGGPVTDPGIDAGPTSGGEDSGAVAMDTDSGRPSRVDAAMPPEVDAATPMTSVSMATFTVTTMTINGQYAPRNIGAIWIETSSGQYVKTLDAWAARRSNYLNLWNSAKAGDSMAADAVSSATLSSHRTHEAVWDLTDRSGASVSPGSYRIRVQMTEGNNSGRDVTLPFDLGTTPNTIMFNNMNPFSNMSLVIE